MSRNKKLKRQNGMPTLDYIKSKTTERSGMLNTKCWVWQHAMTQDGYGQVCYWDNNAKKKVNIGAHRLAFKIAKPEQFDDKLVIRHQCHNKSCCNPDHLKIGTYTENYLDNVAIGKLAHNVKFTEEQVREIKSSYQSARHFANKFNMPIRHILQVIRGECWAWVQCKTVPLALREPAVFERYRQAYGKSIIDDLMSDRPSRKPRHLSVKYGMTAQRAGEMRQNIKRALLRVESRTSNKKVRFGSHPV